MPDGKPLWREREPGRMNKPVMIVDMFREFMSSAAAPGGWA